MTTSMTRMSRSSVRRIKKRLDEIDVQLAASDETDPLDEFRHGDPAAGVWESLSMARRRAVVQTLIGSITVLPVARKGRYPFDPDRMKVTPQGDVPWPGLRTVQRCLTVPIDDGNFTDVLWVVIKASRQWAPRPGWSTLGNPVAEPGQRSTPKATGARENGGQALRRRHDG